MTVTKGTQLLFALQFCYIIALGLCKLSILCFYGNLFSSRDRLDIKLKIMILITTSWLISFTFATIFQIWPIPCNWKACVRNSATNYPVMYILNNVTDIILDIVTLCLPALYIKDIQMSLNKRIGMAFILGLGLLYVNPLIELSVLLTQTPATAVSYHQLPGLPTW